MVKWFPFVQKVSQQFWIHLKKAERILLEIQKKWPLRAVSTPLFTKSASIHLLIIQENAPNEAKKKPRIAALCVHTKYTKLPTKAKKPCSNESNGQITS